MKTSLTSRVSLIAVLSLAGVACGESPGNSSSPANDIGDSHITDNSDGFDQDSELSEAFREWNAIATATAAHLESNKEGAADSQTGETISLADLDDMCAHTIELYSRAEIALSELVNDTHADHSPDIRQLVSTLYTLESQGRSVGCDLPNTDQILREIGSGQMAIPSDSELSPTNEQAAPEPNPIISDPPSGELDCPEIKRLIQKYTSIAESAERAERMSGDMSGFGSATTAIQARNKLTKLYQLAAEQTCP